jgi:hypothetical protein
MVGLGLGEILLEEAQVRISARNFFSRAGSYCNFGFCGLSCVVCRKLCSEVGGECRCDGGGWQRVGLDNSDVCVLGLLYMRF